MFATCTQWVEARNDAVYMTAKKGPDQDVNSAKVEKPCSRTSPEPQKPPGPQRHSPSLLVFSSLPQNVAAVLTCILILLIFESDINRTI